MLQFDPKKTKKIYNKSIPSPLRPKFRNKSANNMYFLSKGKTLSERKEQFKNIIIATGAKPKIPNFLKDKELGVWNYKKKFSC